MKQSEKNVLIIESIFIAMLILNAFLFKVENTIIISIFLLLFFIVAVEVLGYEKDRHRYKKDGILLGIIFATCFQIFIYLFGIITGFLQNGYSLKLINIFRNAFPSLILIIITELFRYQLITKSQERQSLKILTTILFIVLDIIIMLPLYNLYDSRNFIEFLSIIVIPSISKNILFTYFVLKFGYLTNICYRVIMELTVYIVPILPNINIYLDSIFKFTFPIVIFMYSQKVLKVKKDIEVRKSKFSKIANICVTLFLLVVVFLTSGVFSHYALVIGSDSMNPSINKGDIVIVKKIDNEQISDIKIGDTLVFNMKDKVVVHRVYNVNPNDSHSFITKGDNNEEADNWVVNENNIIGVVIAKIPIVGYPTVWLNEMIGG